MRALHFLSMILERCLASKIDFAIPFALLMQWKFHDRNCEEVLFLELCEKWLYLEKCTFFTLAASCLFTMKVLVIKVLYNMLHEISFIFIIFFYVNRRNHWFRKIFYFRFLMHLHALGCPELDLIISGKSLCICTSICLCVCDKIL